MTTEVRKVVVDRTDGDNAVIGKGLAGGERLVVRGQLRLAPGAKVTTRN
jgi:multidrug efflux system membrane fusion protein